MSRDTPKSPHERLIQFLADGDELLVTARDRVHIKYCPDSRCGERGDLSERGQGSGA